MNDLNSRIAISQQKIAQQSNFQTNPPIDIKEVVEIENHYEIILPSYRTFITTIGNGGVKQNYGLLSLQDSLMYLEAVKQEKRLDKEFLKIPFTHTSTYNPNEDPYILELGEKCDRGEILQSEYYALYDYLTAETMTIFVEGCGYCCFLVITGATRGQVWFNADAGDGGYIPLHLSFLDWYENNY